MFVLFFLAVVTAAYLLATRWPEKFRLWLYLYRYSLTPSVMLPTRKHTKRLWGFTVALVTSRDKAAELSYSNLYNMRPEEILAQMNDSWAKISWLSLIIQDSGARKLIFCSTDLSLKARWEIIDCECDYASEFKLDRELIKTVTIRDVSGVLVVVRNSLQQNGYFLRSLLVQLNQCWNSFELSEISNGSIPTYCHDMMKLNSQTLDEKGGDDADE